MADHFDLDIVPFVAPVIRINTPEGSLELRSDMTPGLYKRVRKWMLGHVTFKPFDDDDETPAPDAKTLYELAAEGVHVSVETSANWGFTACVMLLDFLVQGWLTQLTTAPNKTNGSTPPVMPSGSRSRRKEP